MDPMSDAADLVTSTGEAPATRRTDRLPPRAFRLGVRHHHSEGHAGQRAAWLRAAVLGGEADGVQDNVSLRRDGSDNQPRDELQEQRFAQLQSMGRRPINDR